MKPTLLVAGLLFAATCLRAEEAAVTSDPATWPAEVKAAYDEIRALPLEKKAEIKTALFALAARGRLARPALGALAADGALPEPQRALGGILFSHFARFDPAALRTLAEGSNPFAQREAIVLLCQLGAKEDAEFLEGLSKRTESAGLKTHIARSVAAMPAVPYSARSLELLDRVVNGEADAKRESCAALAVDYGHGTQAALLAIVKDAVTDDDARLYASAAIAEANARCVADLESLCDRSHHKVLRWCAMRELAKSDQGKTVLRKFLESADEPLKPNIEKLLATEDK